ncbi:substrate-binding domain-containing protein [Streptomyces capparidis]
MLVEKRHDSLLEELRATGSVRVAELAARFGVSTGTIRRDIAELADQGKLVKVRGGALPLPGTAREGGRAAEEAAPDGAADRPGRTVGLLVPSATYYYPQVVAGVRAVAARRGARVVLGITAYDHPRDLDRLDELAGAGADGFLVTSAGGTSAGGTSAGGDARGGGAGAGDAGPEAALRRLRALDLPFVLVERRPQDPYEPCEYVVSDHRQGAYAAVLHLKRLGHVRVGLFTTESPTAGLVRQGHADAVRRLDLDPAAPVLAHPRAVSAERDCAAFLDACLVTGTRAALVHSDQDAIELQRCLRARGLRVPEDLALVAYDDEIAALAEVPLTAVSPAKRQLGEQAAHLLLDRLTGTASPALRQVTLLPSLVVRASCGSAAPPPRERNG